MSKVKIARIRKRDGSIVPFDARKIEDAIFKAPAAAPPAPEAKMLVTLTL